MQKLQSLPKVREFSLLKFISSGLLMILFFCLSNSFENDIKEMIERQKYNSGMEAYVKAEQSDLWNLHFWFLVTGGVCVIYFLYQLLLWYVERSLNRRRHIYNEYYPEIEDDPAFIESMEYIEDKKITERKQVVQIDVQVEKPIIKTKEQLEREEKDKQYNKQVAIITKIALTALLLFVVFRVVQMIRN